LVTGLACWFLTAFRYQTGNDYRFYEAIFNAVSNAGASEYYGSIEPGYLLLNFVVCLFTKNYRIFLLLFHFIITALVFIWIGRYSTAPVLSVYLFVTLQYFALSMNFMRQAIAAAVLLWIYPFLSSRRFLPCCILIFAASCFHWTALIMLPLCLLLRLKISVKHYVSAAIAALFAYFFMDPVIQMLITLFPKYAHYVTEKYWRGNSFIYALMPICCFIFILPLLRQSVRGYLTASPVLVNCMFYSFLIQIFITRHFILERLSVYVSFFSLLALPEAAQVSSPLISCKTKHLILILGGMVYFLFSASQGFHGVYPYFGIWDKAASF